MEKIILLFDMDGVLIRSRGYYRSLQAVIKLIGGSLGLGRAELSMDLISKMEAFGIYHIWDHLTYFSSLLLIHRWRTDPEVRISVPLISLADNQDQESAIDFLAYIQELSQGETYSLFDLAEILITNNRALNESQRAYLELLYESSREIYQSPVLPIMQEFVLGSEQFSQTYDLSPQMDLESYPGQFDQPVLSSENKDRLDKWLENDHHHAAIFTSRPSLPPDPDYFGTPEAEIGARICDLETLPIIGAGPLDWAAEISDIPLRTFNKPHPVHALAAMQAALGRDIKTALIQAVDLTTKPEGSIDRAGWLDFENARIVAIEDSPSGLRSAINAVNILSDVGIPVQLELIGIGYQENKIESLLVLTDQTYRDLNVSPLIDIISGV